MDTLSKLLDFNLISIGDYEIKVYTLVLILIIILFTRVILKLIKTALFQRYKGLHLDKGNTYALYQIIKYVIWVIAIGLILESVGIKVTILIAGSAALLVGVGLGLQQTFNDVISGIILLSEKSIKINDILEIDGDVVEIQEIGLRTSRGLNRNDIAIIIPNSLITTNKVINWSHQKKKTRFKVGVGVAYGSDVDLVVRILEESVLEHPDFDDTKMIEGRFVNFGNSSLDFEVLFFSENVFRIEKVKSDIIRIINRKLSENKNVITFT
ncbi:MAG: mechanosensitive ion channel, partial [Arenibacter sp.]